MCFIAAFSWQTCRYSISSGGLLYTGPNFAMYFLTNIFAFDLTESVTINSSTERQCFSSFNITKWVSCKKIKNIYIFYAFVMWTMNKFVLYKYNIKVFIANVSNSKGWTSTSHFVIILYLFSMFVVIKHKKLL